MSAAEKDQRLSLTERELRRRTYTITASDIQSAVSLIPADEGANATSESNIEISGDEDEFDEVFHLENGELFRQDINAILAALGQAAHQQEERFLDMLSLSLPQPPSCFADEMEVFRKESSNKNGDAIVSRKADGSEGISDRSADVTGQQVSPAKGPRISKPDLTKSVSSSSIDQENSKAIRGRRKPLYPGRKREGLLMRDHSAPKPNNTTVTKPASQNVSRVGAVSKASPSLISSSSRNSSRVARPTRNRSSSSKAVSSTPTNARSSSSSKAKTKVNSSNIPQAKSGLSAKATLKANPSPNQNSVARPNISYQEKRPVTSLLKPKTSGTNKTVPGHKSAGGVLIASKTNTKSAIARPNSVCKKADDIAGSGTISAVAKLSPSAVPEESDTVEERRERVVSPGAVLHRAAGGDGMSNYGERKSKSCPSPVNRRLHSPSSSSSTKPQAVSRIAGLWKSKPTTTLTCANKSKRIGISKPAGSARSARNDNGMGKEELTYVSAISFREQSNQSTRTSPTDQPSAQPHPHSPPNGDSLCTDSPVVDPGAGISSDAVTRTSVDECSSREVSALPTAASDSVHPPHSQSRLLTDKNSAIVNPYMYRQPAHQLSSSDGPTTDSSEGDAVAATPADALIADFSTQANFYGQENKITVHLDIKPCITLSDVSHSLVVDPPSQQYHLPCSHTNAAEPAMTKTEMLLRRRSEILSRQKDCPSHWQPSKSTDV